MQDRAHPEESHPPLQRCDEKREKPEEVSTKRYKRGEKLSLEGQRLPVPQVEGAAGRTARASWWLRSCRSYLPHVDVCTRCCCESQALPGVLMNVIALNTQKCLRYFSSPRPEVPARPGTSIALQQSRRRARGPRLFLRLAGC